MPVWPAKSSWQVQEMAPIGVGSYRALRPGAALHLDIPPQPRGVAAVHLRLRLFKPTDQDLWSMVETSYRNLLRYDDLKAALAKVCQLARLMVSTHKSAADSSDWGKPLPLFRCLPVS